MTAWAWLSKCDKCSWAKENKEHYKATMELLWAIENTNQNECKCATKLNVMAQESMEKK